ncbi:ferredoxin [Nocardia jiangxiensis]|uniref:Ferredoxin n=1 Tax=Nocardia jiangxiensis TaxID=282685 RepID=A0ABW6SCA0_9NOCA
MSNDEQIAHADRAVCAGSGLCAYVAPNHFEVRDGVVAVIRARIAPSDSTQVTEAIDSCPTRALSLRAAAEPSGES